MYVNSKGLWFSSCQPGRDVGFTVNSSLKMTAQCLVMVKMRNNVRNLG